MKRDLHRPLRGQVAERDGEMRLAHARRAQQHDVLGALHEGQAGQLEELLAWRTAGKAPVVALQRLDRRKARDTGGHLLGAYLPGLGLRAQHILEEVPERRLARYRSLRRGRPRAINNLQPQLFAECGDAGVLEIAHDRASLPVSPMNGISAS